VKPNLLRKNSKIRKERGSLRKEESGGARVSNLKKKAWKKSQRGENNCLKTLGRGMGGRDKKRKEKNLRRDFSQGDRNNEQGGKKRGDRLRPEVE